MSRVVIGHKGAEQINNASVMHLFRGENAFISVAAGDVVHKSWRLERTNNSDFTVEKFRESSESI